jgi:nitroreductase
VITTNVETISVVAIDAEKLAGLGNPAPAGAAIHKLIRERWSPRAFSSAPVPREHLHALLEAARWAPSSMNEQPWRFIVADRHDDPEGHARIGSALVPFNAAWALRAPVLMIVVAKTAFTQNGAPNRHALYDTGQAVALLSLQATAFSLAVHQMGGFDQDRARLLLGIPDGYEPIAALALGCQGDAAELSPDVRARETAPRQRRPTAEWTYSGRWSEPWAPRAESME